MDTPNFSRNSALFLGNDSITIHHGSYRVLERARILCTRGYGDDISNQEINMAINQLDNVYVWMNNLIEKAKGYE